MKSQSIKNLFIAGLTLLSFGFLSAQFVIPSGIDNALQIIQRVLVTTTGTSTGAVVMDSNTGTNRIYINPAFLATTGAYSGGYLLTLDNDGYLSFTTGSTNISGATISGGNLILTLSNGTTINAGAVTGPQGPAGTPGSQGTTGPQGPAGPQGSTGPQGAMGATGTQGLQGIQGIQGIAGVGINTIIDNMNGTFTINLSNGSGYTINMPSGGAGGPQILSLIGNDLTISNGNTIDLGLGFWSLLGNAGTNSTINFIGTTDTQDLVFKTNNQERMRILGTSGYVGIGTNNPVYPLTVSGGLYTYENEVGFFVGNDGNNIANGYPIPGVFMGIDATASSGSSTSLSLYDTRIFSGSDAGLGLNISTMTGIGINGLESEATLNTSDGEKMDLRVEQGFDYSAYNQGNGNGIVTSNNRSKIEMESNLIALDVGTGTVYTVAGGSLVNTDYTYKSSIDIDSFSINMYGSGGFANMYFDGVIGIFGFGTNTPGNTIDIARAYVPGTAGLRFSHRAGPNAGQILGLDGNGDVVMLGNISGFGGSPSSPNYLKLGELDYTQLNSQISQFDPIPLINGNPLPANSLIKRLFVQVNTGFGNAGFSMYSGFIFSSNSIDNFALFGGTNIFDVNNGMISPGYGSMATNPFGIASTWSVVPPTIISTNPGSLSYSVYVGYSTSNPSSDWVQGNASFVVEYEIMPALPF